MIKTQRKQTGAVSLFVVIFTTIIVTVITVSFTQLMLRNQEQATTNDLSQSAYDSALAGVEDAKRVLLKAAECDSDCGPLNNVIDDGKCNTIQRSGLQDDTNGEVIVNSELEQAYTCVKIDTETENIKTGLIPKDSSYLVPLKTGGKAFEKVRISWFTKSDGGQADSAVYPSLDPGAPATPLIPQDQWGALTPPLARSQFVLSNSASRSVFLYPVENLSAGLPVDDVRLRSADNGDKNSSDAPVQPINCVTQFDARANGVCSAEIDITDLGRIPTNLVLLPIYNSASFTVELFDENDNQVNFDGVQPMVDSTGRAANLFRRVEARIDIRSGANPEYPAAAVNVENNFCKSFFVTNDADDYRPGECSPADSN